MRIDLHSNPHPLPEATRTRSQSAPVPNASAVRTQAAEDEAVLSGAYIEVQALAAQVAQLPEVRNERVQALREAVETGSYSADAREVAGAILAEMICRSAA